MEPGLTKAHEKAPAVSSRGKRSVVDLLGDGFPHEKRHHGRSCGAAQRSRALQATRRPSSRHYCTVWRLIRRSPTATHQRKSRLSGRLASESSDYFFVKVNSFPFTVPLSVDVSTGLKLTCVSGQPARAFEPFTMNVNSSAVAFWTTMGKLRPTQGLPRF